jgi:hypothetical protein
MIIDPANLMCEKMYWAPIFIYLYKYLQKNENSKEWKIKWCHTLKN